jgi:hypothetical protein
MGPFLIYSEFVVGKVLSIKMERLN